MPNPQWRLDFFKGYKEEWKDSTPIAGGYATKGSQAYYRAEYLAMPKSEKQRKIKNSKDSILRDFLAIVHRKAELRWMQNHLKPEQKKGKSRQPEYNHSK